MWLARSLPPLLSHLRPPASACVGSLLPAGSTNRVLSLSRVCTSAGANNLYRDPADGAPVAARTGSASSDRPHLCSCCLGTNQLLQHKRRHLYLVLDDWKSGFSLHKISIDDLLAGGNSKDADMEPPRRLPQPIFRLGFIMVGSNPRFHALGSNIVVTSDGDYFVYGEHAGRRGHQTLVYDTKSAELQTEHSLPMELTSDYHAVAAGEKLYTFTPCSKNGGLLYLCKTECRSPRIDFIKENIPYCLRPQLRWTWKSGLPPPPMITDKDGAVFISARALHPDGRTIFVSLKRSRKRDHELSTDTDSDTEHDESDQELGTYSLDTDGGEWRRQGDWCLPFTGQAHYDGDLSAWVGTHTVHNSEDGCSYEHLCSCDVPLEAEGPAPAWKVQAERLTFLKSPLKSMSRHVLVRMGCTDGAGSGGLFCLVERARPQGVTLPRSMGDGDNCLLHVTMFRAKYSKNGELTSTPLWYGPSYLMSRYVWNHDLSAFWT